METGGGSLRPRGRDLPALTSPKLLRRLCEKAEGRAAQSRKRIASTSAGCGVLVEKSDRISRGRGLWGRFNARLGELPTASKCLGAGQTCGRIAESWGFASVRNRPWTGPPHDTRTGARWMFSALIHGRMDPLRSTGTSGFARRVGQVALFPVRTEECKVASRRVNSEGRMTQ